MTEQEPAWKRLADQLARIGKHRTMTQTPAISSQIGAKTARTRTRPGAESALAKTAFEASVSPETRDLLKKGKALVVVVRVPDLGWVSPISTHISSITDAKRMPRDGSQKTKDLPSEGNDQVLAALADGRSVIGISQDPDRYLPSALIAAADVTITVQPPDGAALTRAIALCLGGGVPKTPPDNLGAGLDFIDLAAALRPGSKPADAVHRLQAAMKGRANGDASQVLPTLRDAVFYGDARTWGLTLAAEVEEAKKTGDWSGVDRGILYGEPGTGKTYLARMIAAECKLPIFEHSVADLFGGSAGYLDSCIKAQRSAFAKAAAMAPCVMHWDEIEAMPNRATLSSSRSREFFQILCDDFLLLVASAKRSVILLGATNAHPDEIDKALVRPGQFERMIEIKPPATAEGLAGILRFHLRDDLGGEDLLPLARVALGATAAEAMEIVRRARRAARTGKRPMVLDDLAAVIMQPDTRSKQLQRQTALHEAAHAVITLKLGAEELRSVSIVRGADDSGGRMSVRTAPALGSQGREHFEKVAIGTLAGRAAEVLLCDGATAGAGGHPNSDLAVVSRLCAAIHASLGLADSLLYRGSPDSLDTALLYDPTLRATVDADMKRLHRRAEELVLEHRLEIKAVADALLIRRHLEGDEVRRIVGATKPAVVKAGKRASKAGTADHAKLGTETEH